MNIGIIGSAIVGQTLAKRSQKHRYAVRIGSRTPERLEDLASGIQAGTHHESDRRHPPVDAVLQFFTGPNSSLMEQLWAQFPDARFVKAFNSVGNEPMVNPVVTSKPPTSTAPKATSVKLKNVKIRGYVTDVGSPRIFDIEDYRITRADGLTLDFEDASPEIQFGLSGHSRRH